MKGCKCPECTAAHRDYMRTYLQGRRDSQTPAERERLLARKRELAAAKRAERVAAGLPAVEWTESRQTSYARRRAVRAGVAAETISPRAIFDRDGWQCGICESPVDPALAHPEPMSASLDHIVPISLGGEHVAANVRCSHLTCNVRRGNRVA